MQSRRWLPHRPWHGNAEGHGSVGRLLKLFSGTNHERPVCSVPVHSRTVQFNVETHLLFGVRDTILAAGKMDQEVIRSYLQCAKTEYYIRQFETVDWRLETNQV